MQRVYARKKGRHTSRLFLLNVVVPRHGLFDHCRQLERLGDRHPADLAGRYVGEDEVVVFQRPG
jgi:hypothetical protein